MGRSINRLTIIGNVVKDPELRNTQNDSVVCNFTVATNWPYTKDGQELEETEFHRAVAFGKLGELCSQLLKKGSRTFLEGRLQSRKFTDKEGVEREVKEVVVHEMIVLDKSHENNP